jgi:hypothetical protein
MGAIGCAAAFGGSAEDFRLLGFFTRLRLLINALRQLD